MRAVKHDRYVTVMHDAKSETGWSKHITRNFGHILRGKLKSLDFTKQINERNEIVTLTVYLLAYFNVNKRLHSPGRRQVINKIPRLALGSLIIRSIVSKHIHAFSDLGTIQKLYFLTLSCSWTASN